MLVSWRVRLVTEIQCFGCRLGSSLLLWHCGCNMLGLPGGLPGILTFFGVGWGGVGMIPFLAIAHISVLRN